MRHGKSRNLMLVVVQWGFWNNRVSAGSAKRLHGLEITLHAVVCSSVICILLGVKFYMYFYFNLGFLTRMRMGVSLQSQEHRMNIIGRVGLYMCCRIFRWFCFCWSLVACFLLFWFCFRSAARSVYFREWQQKQTI